jgi:hypothetical protein
MHEILSKIIALLTVAIFITDGANAETEIKRAQYLLKNLGYNIGFIDGIWGNKSEKAITEFFEKNEIYWDGQIDKKEVEILEKYSKPQTSSKKPLLAKVDKERKSNQLYSLSAFEKDVDYFSDTTLIKLLSANNNFQVLEMFAKNEDVFLNIVGSLELLLAVYLADPSEANSDILKRQYMILFDSGFASKLKGKNNDDGMLLEGFLIGLIYAFDTLSNNNNLHFDEKIRFDVEVRKRFNILKTYMDNHYTMSSCILGQSDAELFECQNHTYHKQLNRTAYGYVFDSKKDFAMGEKLLQ